MVNVVHTLCSRIPVVGCEDQKLSACRLSISETDMVVRNRHTAGRSEDIKDKKAGSLVLDRTKIFNDDRHMNDPEQSNIKLPTNLLGQLDGRDVALWLSGGGVGADAASAAMLCRLPWALVLADRFDQPFLSSLEEAEPVDDPLVRRRGLVHLVDTDPAEVPLPPRHLAVLLLNGRGAQRRTGLAAITRRLTMLQDLRRRSIRQLVIAVDGTFAIPDELGELWADGFRMPLLFVSDDPDAQAILAEWRREFSAQSVDLLQMSPEAFGDNLRRDFLRGRDGAAVVRVRDEDGGFRVVNASTLDDPERPVLGGFELLGTDVLTPLLPSDLTADEVEGFFSDAASSWRPYAAGMAWRRDPKAWDAFRSRLRSLDRKGADENRIMYVSAEAGAGATAFLRDFAWRAAAEGYPTFVANRGPVTINGLAMSGFLTRLVGTDRDQAEGTRLYETPCVIVFDQNHWSGRESELLSFARELERSGRRVCILVAMGPMVGLGVLTERRFVALTSLTHRVMPEQALDLGRHLNRFLAPHGTDRSEQEWRNFFAASIVGAGQGVAAFWIVLSFWLQRQVDLGETVQSRVYRAFRDQVPDVAMKVALLRIAAFSTVREPLPDELLPETIDWPVSERIEDMRKELGVLGLVRVHGEIERYWAMAHNLLGRYLVNSVFYDHSAREELGYAAAANPEHLRFLILKDISALPCLQRSGLREVADSFAVSIFKIDPDHGHGTLTPFWREVLEALDGMPHALRTTSRTFLHHCSISRRRIASDTDTFVMTDSDRLELLRRAVGDLEAALRLDTEVGGDTDINLYNSLAHALHDLAEAEAAAGVEASLVEASRAAAHDATRRAYVLNPDNSFVVETYARALLAEGAANEAFRIQRSLEVLNLVYSLLGRPTSGPRRNALARLAERAFQLLMSGEGASDADAATESGAIAIALAALGAGVTRSEYVDLAGLPPANRGKAASLLAVPLLAGNVQAIKLRYMLAVIDQPQDFELQLELLETLYGSGPAFTPQLELEMAVLLFQRERSHEGERAFKRLRALWRRGEHYVEVPRRLHWLLNPNGSDRRQVRARVVSHADGRAFARVADFGDVEVPFRSAEFDQMRPVPGTAIAGFVSFGHNGPLLRPLTAPRR